MKQIVADKELENFALREIAADAPGPLVDAYQEEQAVQIVSDPRTRISVIGDRGTQNAIFHGRPHQP